MIIEILSLDHIQVQLKADMRSFALDIMMLESSSRIAGEQIGENMVLPA